MEDPPFSGPAGILMLWTGGWDSSQSIASCHQCRIWRNPGENRIGYSDRSSPGSISGTLRGAFSLARKLLSWIGPRRLHAAMASIGYLISIPVFADSGFIIMHSLNKSLTKQAGYSMAGTGTALMLGLMLTHTMVPPTPGPIAAAGIIGADLGLVILWGLIVSFIVLIPAILYSRLWADKTYIAPQVDMEDEVETEKHFRVPYMPSFRSSYPFY